METALTGLAVAVLAMLAGLIPYLGAAAKAALVVYTESRHNKALDAGATTIVTARLGSTVDEQVALLRSRFPDAIAALAPADAVLADKLAKARRLFAAVAAPTGLEERGA